MVSGYKLINLKDKNLTIDGDSVEIEGIYDSIEYNYRKPTILTGLTIDGIECSNRWVNFRVLNGEFVGEVGFNDEYSHLMIKVSQDDMVSIFNF